MKRLLALGLILSSGVWSWAQTSEAAQSASVATGNSVGAAQSTPANIYRDPYTGQLYQQEFQTVDQPTTSWQRRYIDRTVVTPRTVIENQQVPQTYYVAKTEYVLQTRLKGWWNPFAQPTYAYEYVPVTRWVPQTQMVTRQVPSVKMLASTEKVPVDEPVQTTQKVTQVVTRPLPAGTPIANTAVAASTNNSSAANPTSGAGANPSTNWVASNPVAAYMRPTSPVQANGWVSPSHPSYYKTSQPLLASIPVLGRQPSQAVQPGTLLQAPINGMRQVFRATAAPFTGQTSYNNYVQPMNIASQPNSNWGRDTSQSGLPPTIVR